MSTLTFCFLNVVGRGLALSVMGRSGDCTRLTCAHKYQSVQVRSSRVCVCVCVAGRRGQREGLLFSPMMRTLP